MKRRRGGGCLGGWGTGGASGPESNCFSSFAAKVPSSDGDKSEGNGKKRGKQRRRYYVCALRVNFGNVENIAGKHSRCHPWLSLISGGKGRRSGRDGLIKERLGEGGDGLEITFFFVSKDERYKRRCPWCWQSCLTDLVGPLSNTWWCCSACLFYLMIVV